MPPSATQILNLIGPIERWDEAIPLGDGQSGVLLWGDSHLLKLSLDRGDLWDERTGGVSADSLWHYDSITEAVLKRDQEELFRHDELCDRIPATKIPAGRLEIDWESAGGAHLFELDFTTGLAEVRNGDSKTVASCFAVGDSSYIYLRCPGLQSPPASYQGESRLLEETANVNCRINRRKDSMNSRFC